MNNLRKKELNIKLYTDQLHSYLRPIVFSGFQSLYFEAIKDSPNVPFDRFLVFLKGVISWNDVIINKEVDRIKHESGLGSYIIELFRIVMHMIILMMTMIPDKKYNTLQIPNDVNFKKFIHITYIKTAELIFSSPRLFVVTDNEITNQENINKINQFIDEGIEYGINHTLPIKFIVDNFKGFDDEALTEEIRTIYEDQEVSVAKTRSINKDTSVSKTSVRDTSVKKTIDEDKSDSSNLVIDDKSIQVDESKKKDVKEMSKSEKSTKETYESNSKSKKKKIEKLKVESKPDNNNEQFPLSAIEKSTKKQVQNVEDSEAYYLRGGKKLDIFSNRHYEHVSTVKTPNNDTDSGDVNTELVKQYVGKMPKESTASSSVQRNTTKNKSKPKK